VKQPMIPRLIFSATVVVLLSACEPDQSQHILLPEIPAANSARGAQLIAADGCGGCHVIPGINNASGVVGPPLTNFGQRIYVAGMLRNTPDNLIAWIENPQSVVPGNAMPNMGIEQADAQDMAAYLYTLR
jgi:cytochrome c2